MAFDILTNCASFREGIDSRPKFRNSWGQVETVNPYDKLDNKKRIYEFDKIYFKNGT